MVIAVRELSVLACAICSTPISKGSMVKHIASCGRLSRNVAWIFQILHSSMPGCSLIFLVTRASIVFIWARFSLKSNASFTTFVDAIAKLARRHPLFSYSCRWLAILFRYDNLQERLCLRLKGMVSQYGRIGRSWFIVSLQFEYLQKIASKSLPQRSLPSARRSG
jgi:hypothetical protein